MPELTTVQIHLTALITELKKNAKILSESEFDDLLKDEVLPDLIKDEQVFSTSIFSKMQIIKTVQIDSILDERGFGMEESIGLMNANAICWMVEYVNHITDLIKMLEFKRKFNHEDEDMPRTIDYLERESKELTKWLLCDAFNRNQEYEHELKELNGRK
jgi:hypothetical protein